MRAYCVEAVERRLLLHGGVSHLTHGTSTNDDHHNDPAADTQLVAGEQFNAPAGSLSPVAPQAIGDQLLPDMFPLISDPDDYVHGWTLDQVTIPGRTLLRLTTAVANQGHGAMELRGGTVNPDGTQNVFQRIFLEGGGSTDRLAGTFSYHPGHAHIHFDGFAAYHLRTVTAGNGVGAIVASGDKVSFCLLDVDHYNGTLPGSPASNFYNTCGSFQGISVGWADVYSQNLEDQWIDVTDVADGQYWLEVVADPDNHLVELNESNNAGRILINLVGPTEEPRVESSFPAGAALVSADHLEFEFNERMNPASFSVADDVIGFTGPGGVNLLGQVTGHSWTPDGKRLRVNFNTQTTLGAYSMTIGPQILSFDNAHAMNQDNDGIVGEVPSDRYVANFTLQTSIGPDGFGYRAFANPLQPIDLEVGQPGVAGVLTSADDAVGVVDLGAGNTFNFYGVSYPAAGAIFASDNGLITFGSGVNTATNSDLTSTPTTRTVSPLWDDWRTDEDSADAVLSKVEDINGDGVADRIVIEWSQVQHYPASLTPVTFQAILHLNTGATPGAIVYNYVDVDTGDDATDGRSSTVGIKDTGTQSGAGARRLLLSRNASGTVTSGTALRIATVDGAVTADITDVAPDPRNNSVSSIPINFSEKVGGFTLADLVLQRDGGGPNLLAGSGATLASSDGGMNWTLGNLSTLTNPVGAYRLSLAAAGSGVTGLGGNPLLADAVDTWTRVAAAPQVTAVFVAGTAWNSAYRNSLVTAGTGEAAAGYRLAAGDAGLTLAWSNLNQISLRFSEAVTLAAGELTVGGVNVASYGVSAFFYDPATFTATWMLDRTVPNDKLALNLTNAAVTYATNVRVLPGDIDRNNAVNVFDFNVLRPNLNQTGRGVLGGDINGDNVVNVFDFNDFRTYLGKTTPT